MFYIFRCWAHLVSTDPECTCERVATFVGVGAGLEALDGNTTVRVCAGACLWGDPKTEEFIPARGEPSGVLLEG